MSHSKSTSIDLMQANIDVSIISILENQIIANNINNNKNMTSSVVDYENLMSSGFSEKNSASLSLRTVRPRWERKKMQQERSVSSSQSDSNSSGDRFITNRSAMDMEKAAHAISESAAALVSDDGASSGSEDESDLFDGDIGEEYRNTLKTAMLGDDHRVLSFKEKAPVSKGDTVNNLQVLYSGQGTASRATKSNMNKLVSRHIPSAPSRILDAPDLLDDYYLNLLSWSDTNVLSVVLGQTVYLWNASSGDIQELCTYDRSEESYISSVSWVQQGGGHIALGTSDGTVELWDVHAGKKLRTMDGHGDRVGALSWNQHILSSGGRDSVVVNHDVRVSRHNIATLSGHDQEVCGLSWSPDGSTLASGGNDNKLCLWDASTSGVSSQTRYTLTDHQAAVKALAWSPHERNLLATGGGTADRSIKFWNTRTGALLNSIDTGSQVCALQWNPFEKELLSSHGFARNQLCLWKYPTMVKVKELDGHTARVLHMACSPDGSTVVSAAADETLRFWNVFAPPDKVGSKRSVDGHGARRKKLSKTMYIR